MVLLEQGSRLLYGWGVLSRLLLNRWCLLGVVSTLFGLVQCESRLLTLGRVSSDGGMSGSDGSGGNDGGQAGDSSALGGTSAGGASGNAGSGQGGTSGGTSAFTEPLFGAPELVTELAGASDEDTDENPTLTADMLEIFFNSDREGSQDSDDVWMARRDSVDAQFDAPIAVETVNTTASESSPAISADGQTLWIGVERDGGLGGRDIWRFDRTSQEAEFSEPTLETELCSTENDIPRPLGNGQLTMPMASARGGTAYLTYFGTRSDTTALFPAPALVDELIVDDYRTTDAFLTDDGLTLYFVRADSDTTGDLYAAHRTSKTATFGEAIALSTINTDADERDPWLSLDESVLYFVSDRDGAIRIYRALRVTE